MNLIKAALCAFIAFLLIFLPWTNGFQSLKKDCPILFVFFWIVLLLLLIVSIALGVYWLMQEFAVLQ